MNIPLRPFAIAAVLLLTGCAGTSEATPEPGKVPPLHVYFADAGGIRVGDPVLLLGKPVGKVSEIVFVRERSQNRVRLLLRIEEGLALTVAQTIEIQDSGVLGSKLVYVNPGHGAQWPADRELVGTNG